MKKIVFSALSLVLFSTVRSQTVIPLYNGKIPNSIQVADEEAKSFGEIPFISNVSRPTLTIYLPSASNSNGTAVLICPGGGYGGVAFIHEGSKIAEEFNKMGIAAFVLKYRMPNDKWMTDKTIGPLQDAQKAIKLIRKRAKEWNVNVSKVGIAGFSAGGHLASSVGTHFNRDVTDDTEKINLRPDFMILLYPVISFQDSVTHMGSRDNLVGKHPSRQLIDLYSNELQVTPQTPPAFLVHAGDDGVVKVENSLAFYEALHRSGVAAEMIIYPKGGHGFGLTNPTTPDKWMDHCRNWLQSNGWLK